MPSSNELETIYRNAYSAESIAAARTNQETPIFVLDAYVKYIAQFANKSDTILDFGAGTGRLAMALRRAGYRACGYETSSEARRFAEETYGLQMAGSFKELHERSYNLVVMIEVVEHLVDPLSDLVALKKVLRAGGRILISTPNRGGLRARLSGARWSEAQKSFHLYLFKPRSLIRLLRAAGYADARQLIDYPLPDASFGTRAVHRALGYAGLAGRLFVVATVGQ